jgi:hypothetical protein
LKEHGGGGIPVDFEESLDFHPEGVQFAAPLCGGSPGVGILEELSHGFAVQVQGGGDPFL